MDDSVVIRKVLSETLTEDRGLEVVGTASDGRLGLAKIAQLHPDLVTLDVEMPVMNGLETLAELRKLYPKLPVVMFSTLTEHGAAAALDALTLGASDYATKPSNSGNMAAAVEAIRAELIPEDQSAVPGHSETYAACAEADGAGTKAREPAHRNCDHWIFDGRPECFGRSITTISQGFSGAHRDGAAHASDLHAVAGGAVERALRDSGS